MLELPNYYQELFSRLDPKHPNCLSVDKVEDEGHSIIDNLCNWYKYFYDEITRGLENISAENFVPSIGMALKVLQMMFPYQANLSAHTVSTYDFNTTQPIVVNDMTSSIRRHESFQSYYDNMRAGYALMPGRRWNHQYTVTNYNTHDQEITSVQDVCIISLDATKPIADPGSIYRKNTFIELIASDLIGIIKGTVTVKMYAYYALAMQAIKSLPSYITPQILYESGIFNSATQYAHISDISDSELAQLIVYSAFDVQDDRIALEIGGQGYETEFWQYVNVVRYAVPLERNTYKRRIGYEGYNAVMTGNMQAKLYGFVWLERSQWNELIFRINGNDYSTLIADNASHTALDITITTEGGQYVTYINFTYIAADVGIGDTFEAWYYTRGSVTMPGMKPLKLINGCKTSNGDFFLTNQYDAENAIPWIDYDALHRQSGIPSDAHGFGKAFLEDVNGFKDAYVSGVTEWVDSVDNQGFFFSGYGDVPTIPANATSEDIIERTFEFISLGKPSITALDFLTYAQWLDAAWGYYTWNEAIYIIGPDGPRDIDGEPLEWHFTNQMTEYEYQLILAMLNWKDNSVEVTPEHCLIRDETGKPISIIVDPVIGVPFIDYDRTAYEQYAPIFFSERVTKDEMAEHITFLSARDVDFEAVGGYEHRQDLIPITKTYMASKWPEFNELND